MHTVLNRDWNKVTGMDRTSLPNVYYKTAVAIKFKGINVLMCESPRCTVVYVKTTLFQEFSRH